MPGVPLPRLRARLQTPPRHHLLAAALQLLRARHARQLEVAQIERPRLTGVRVGVRALGPRLRVGVRARSLSPHLGSQELRRGSGLG